MILFEGPVLPNAGTPLVLKPSTTSVLVTFTVPCGGYLDETSGRPVSFSIGVRQKMVPENCINHDNCKLFIFFFYI